MRLRRRRNPWIRWLRCSGPTSLLFAVRAVAQTQTVVEDFEFASTDSAAANGVTDLSDVANQPTFFISGSAENASPNEPGGLFSIGTDAVYCINFQVPCDPGTFIGFRRFIDPLRFPDPCAGGDHYVPLAYTYGDPNHPGPVPPDYLLDDLQVVWDVYGDGGFADGLTGTHLWLRLIDCEGEAYDLINYSEVSLYSEIWTFDVLQGQGVVRLSPDSLIDVPNGDRLLTEIVAIDVLIQDTDDPPTAIGKWYVDYLRVIEPAAAQIPGDADGDGDVDLVDFGLFFGCLTGPNVAAPGACAVFDSDGDVDVDLVDFRAFGLSFGAGS